ncbi:MAG: ATP synthase subunit I [Candidatus Contendobacter sp.]|nr:ATP synthase subunit I [Candidatus Contendobacter sp.]MDG4558197.1 ATP synthase subunit I [Candidatus Contendobacter sp.]
MRATGAKRVTRTILLIQLLVTLLGAIASLGVSGVQAAYSALIGGGVSTLVTLYFASQVFSVRVGSPAAKIARAFYLGELVKLLLTGVLLSVALLWLEVSPLPLLLAYMAALMAYWLALPFTFDASVRTL